MTSTGPTDYEAVASGYDRCPIRWERGPDPDLAPLLGRRQGPARALELACGTGIQLSRNERAWGGDALATFGLDRSRGMLAEARRRLARSLLCRGDGTRLPFKPALFDYVSCQFAGHHVRPFSALASEAARVLRPGGRFVLWNVDPWAVEDPWFYRWVPEARAIDEGRFLPVEAQVRTLEQAGFTVALRRAAREERLSGDEQIALLADRATFSQLSMLPDTVYRQRLDEARRALAGQREPRLLEGLPLVWLVADRPGA